jgi:hypothetical protein
MVVSLAAATAVPMAESTALKTELPLDVRLVDGWGTWWADVMAGRRAVWLGVLLADDWDGELGARSVVAWAETTGQP